MPASLLYYFPALKIEVAFANNPQTALGSLTWTDISRFVQSLRTTTGRQHELGRVETGTLSMRLVNFDDRFNPFNTTSPYYGPYTDGSDTGVLGLVPMKRVRVTAVWNSVTYNIWHGFIDSWPMVWPTEKTSFVDVTASDAFKFLALRRVTTSKYTSTVLADGVTGYWRLGDPIRTLNPVDSSGNGYTGKITSPTTQIVTFGQAGALITDGNTAADFGTRNGAIVIPQAATISGTGAFSLETWIKFTSAPATNDRWYDQHVVTNTGQFVGFTFDATHTAFTMSDGTITESLTLTQIPPVDNKWHHLVATRASDGKTLTIYLDGASIGSTVAASAANLVQGYGVLAGTLYTPALPGQLDECAVYKTVALSATQVANHYNLGVGGFLQQRSDLRIGAYLDIAAWPAADRSLEAGISNVQQETQDLSQTSVLQAVYDTVDTENGLCFASPDGKITFYNRNHVILNATSTTSQVTLGEGAEPYDLSGTNVLMDDLDIWNEIVEQRVGGIPQTAVDATSQLRYDTRTLSHTNSRATSDAEVADAANYKLGRYKDPVMRVKAVNVHPISDPTNLWPKTLGLGLLDRVTVTRTTQAGGTVYSQPANIERIEHTIDPAGDWHTVWGLSPADSNTYLIIGDSTLGKLSSGNRLYW